jgi:hypothetical protein
MIPSKLNHKVISHILGRRLQLCRRFSSETQNPYALSVLWVHQIDQPYKNLNTSLSLSVVDLNLTFSNQVTSIKPFTLHLDVNMTVLTHSSHPAIPLDL